MHTPWCVRHQLQLSIATKNLAYKTEHERIASESPVAIVAGEVLQPVRVHVRALVELGLDRLHTRRLRRLHCLQVLRLGGVARVPRRLALLLLVLHQLL